MRRDDGSPRSGREGRIRLEMVDEEEHLRTACKAWDLDRNDAKPEQRLRGSGPSIAADKFDGSQR
jgi:hypothetical protein